MLSEIRRAGRYLKNEAKLLRMVMLRSFYVRPKARDDIVNNFHRLYYDDRLFGGTHGITYWMGTPIYKCPMDVFIYQEIIHEQRPDVIIECGTMDGGSTLFMASMCDLIDHGEIISIDITHRKNRPQHPRITYLLGSSVGEEILSDVRHRIDGKQKVMVILDSDHSAKHVRKELAAYHEFVTPGSYLIVEDTNMNGHPVAQEFGPGPMEAALEFLESNDRFEIDKSREKFLLTFNPNGYLRRLH